MEDGPDPASLLPLTPHTLNILLTLGHQELHGYGIMQELERRTDGRETLLPGSLYATLARMVKEGLIEEVEAGGQRDDTRRREYRMTPFGRRVARAELARLEGLIELAQQQDLSPEGP